MLRQQLKIEPVAPELTPIPQKTSASLQGKVASDGYFLEIRSGGLHYEYGVGGANTTGGLPKHSKMSRLSPGARHTAQLAMAEFDVI
jgi:hypothetical protein